MDVQEGGEAVLLRMTPIYKSNNQMMEMNKSNNQMMAMNNQIRTISRTFTRFQTKLKELEDGFNNWVSEQSFPVQDIVYTATNVIAGAGQGFLIGAIGQVAAHVFPQHSPAIKAIVCSPMVEARRFGAGQGTFAGVSCIIKLIRGQDDVQTRMAAGFFCGVKYKLDINRGNPYVVADAAELGVICALLGGCLFQLDQKSSQPPLEYARTRCMLANLGLQNYEKNFKRGLLTDNTLPLLTDSVLKDVGVPPGPRLRILDHIERDSRILNRKRCSKDVQGETDGKINN